jgi:hypothetical protein
MTARFNEISKNRTSRIAIIVGGLVLAATVTACSSQSANWQHPNKPKDKWSADISACKRQASNLIARQLDIDADSNFSNKGDLQVQFAAHDARKKRYGYFTNCLSGKGFRQVSGK